MKLNYFIHSEKRMYSTAVKMMLEELRKNGTIFDTIADLRESLNDNKGTVIIIGPNEATDPYDICLSLSRIYPFTAVVLLLNKEAIDYRKAMFSGAVDVIDIESEETEVIESIGKAEKVVQLKIDNQNGQGEGKEGKVVTVCSTKGGVGKTTIGVNMAVALSLHNLKVAVIDLDLQFGDVPLLFDQQPSQTIYDWVKQSYENGDKSFEGFVSKHKTGTDILAAPSLPEFAELIKEEHVSYLIESMKEKYDVIIIDTPPSFVETSLIALEQSDVILLIASSDLPALKNGKLAIETLNLLGLREKIKVILNRDSDSDGITNDLVEGVLGMGINSKIPSDYQTVIASINRGESIITMAPRTPVAKAIMKLSEQLITEMPKEKPKKPKRDKKKRKGILSLKNRKK